MVVERCSLVHRQVILRIRGAQNAVGKPVGQVQRRQTPDLRRCPNVVGGIRLIPAEKFNAVYIVVQAQHVGADAGAISAVYPPAVSCTHSKPFQFTVSALFFIIINVTSFLFALPFSEISTDCNAPIISYFVCFVQCCEKITHIFYFSGSIARLYVHLPNVDIAGVEGFHVAVEVADNQTAVVGDPHNRRFLRVAVGHLDLHRPPRQAGAGAVFPQETALAEIRQQLFQFAQHGAEQLRRLT